MGPEDASNVFNLTVILHVLSLLDTHQIDKRHQHKIVLQTNVPGEPNKDVQLPTNVIQAGEDEVDVKTRKFFPKESKFLPSTFANNIDQKERSCSPREFGLSNSELSEPPLGSETASFSQGFSDSEMIDMDSVDSRLEILEAQFLPFSFVHLNLKLFEEFTLILLVTDSTVTKKLFVKKLPSVNYLFSIFRENCKVQSFPWVLATRFKKENLVIFPCTRLQCSRTVVSLPDFSQDYFLPYFIPQKPVVSHPLCQIFPLLESDLPSFSDKYGKSSSNQYLTPNWIRPGIAREFGFTASTQVCHPKFRPFISADGNDFQPLPLLCQGKFPTGLVGNGPWLSAPSEVNFTTCYVWLQKSLFQLESAGGFCWIFRWPENVIFNGSEYVSTMGELPLWIQFLQGKDVALVPLTTPVAYSDFLTFEDLPRPDFRSVLIFFGFEPTVLWCEATAENPDFSVLQELKPTQDRWVPSSFLMERVSTIGNAFVVRSAEAEKLLREVSFASKPPEFQKLYVSNRKHPTFEELDSFHTHLAPDFVRLDILHQKSSGGEPE